jgi:protein TonB
VPQLLLAAMPMAAGVVTMAGVVDADRASRPDSLGAGDGGGADRGRGTGIGPGAGSGLGDGVGGGADGGVYRIGTGVTAPQLLRSVRPSYTPEAMRLRLTGTVILECVVDTGGRVERCQLQRSLDRRYGLDEEAMKAAHQWTFVPGTRLGQAVPVFVRLELSFSIQ